METDGDKSNTGQDTKSLALPPEEKSVPVYAELVGNQGHNKKISALEERLDRFERRESRFATVITAATVVSATVAALQWHSMEKQLTQSREATQQQLRPYLLSRAELVTPIAGQPIRIKHFITNYGQSPAVKTQVIAAAFYGTDAMAQAQAWMKRPENSISEPEYGQIIPPGAQADGGSDRMFVVRTSKALTEDDLAKLRETDYLAVTVSRYVYRDSFGDPYGTQNCFQVTKEWELTDCPGQNEIYGPRQNDGNSISAESK